MRPMQPKLVITGVKLRTLVPRSKRKIHDGWHPQMMLLLLHCISHILMFSLLDRFQFLGILWIAYDSICDISQWPTKFCFGNESISDEYLRGGSLNERFSNFISFIANIHSIFILVY